MNVETTEEFDNWLDALRDEVAKAKIASRIDRLANGNPGDVKPVGEGVSEMRIHHGAATELLLSKWKNVGHHPVWWRQGFSSG